MANSERLSRLGLWLMTGLLSLAILARAALAEPPKNQSFSWFESHLPHAGAPFCAGKCAVHVYGGVFTKTGMLSMFGLENLTTFAPERYVPPWKWEFAHAGIIAGAASRRLATVATVIDLEGELGIGQRFGRMNETEVWAGLYARWTWFPWNRHVRTTIAASTGLNLASAVSNIERERDTTRRGSKLLHFFSPEITVGLPTYPDWDLVLRIHHRSGARVLFGDVGMFNGVGGGVHFATLGIRRRF